MCYIYCASIDETNETRYFCLINEAIKNGTLDKDCTVKNADKFLYSLTGRKAVVLKKDIDALDEIKEPAPVRFVAEGYGGHWVVVKDGKIIFNPLASSINVDKGKPVEARIIKWRAE